MKIKAELGSDYLLAKLSVKPIVVLSECFLSAELLPQFLLVSFFLHQYIGIMDCL